MAQLRGTALVTAPALATAGGGAGGGGGGGGGGEDGGGEEQQQQQSSKGSSSSARSRRKPLNGHSQAEATLRAEMVEVASQVVMPLPLTSLTSPHNYPPISPLTSPPISSPPNSFSQSAEFYNDDALWGGAIARAVAASQQVGAWPSALARLCASAGLEPRGLMAAKQLMFGFREFGLAEAEVLELLMRVSPALHGLTLHSGGMGGGMGGSMGGGLPLHSGGMGGGGTAAASAAAITVGASAAATAVVVAPSASGGNGGGAAAWARCVTALARGVEVSQHLVTLNLRHVDLHGAAGEAMAAALRSHPTLTALRLVNNGLGAAALATAVGGAAARQLRTLAVEENPLGSDAALHEVAALVGSSACLTSLSLRGCGLGASAGRHLAQVRVPLPHRSQVLVPLPPPCRCLSPSLTSRRRCAPRRRCGCRWRTSSCSPTASTQAQGARSRPRCAATRASPSSTSTATRWSPACSSRSARPRRPSTRRGAPPTRGAPPSPPARGAPPRRAAPAAASCASSPRSPRGDPVHNGVYMRSAAANKT